MESVSPPSLLVEAGLEAAAEALAAALGLQFSLYTPPLKAVLKSRAQDQQEGVCLVLAREGLGLYALAQPEAGAVRIDLQAGALGWRLEPARVRHEQIVKACALQKAPQGLRIFDATAGLLRDAAVLACAGAEVLVAERSPLIAALIEDGLRRAASIPELQGLLARLHYRRGDSLQLLQTMADEGERPDVVYLDPMFPHRDKSALVKKEMRVFRAVVGEDADADALLAPALAVAQRRVVVKRPKAAPVLAGMKPALVLEGKSGRFDIYLC